MTNTQTVDGLLKHGYDLIHHGDTEQAIAVGNQLLKHRHSRGFEIIALAYEQQGRSSEAISILKDGLMKVPAAWPLWELLGNLYCDQGEFAEAHNSYQKAIACPRADQSSINYYKTVLLIRQNKLDEAMILCDQVQGIHHQLKVNVLRLSIMNGMKRHADAAQFGTQLVQETLNRQDMSDDDMPDLARAFAEIGRAHWEGRQDRQAAWENAWKALEWDRSDDCALKLVREIINRRSPGSKWFKLMVEGKWHCPIEPDKPAPGFITTYEVVADTPQEALSFALDLEPVDVRKSMRIDSHEDLGPFADNQQGVYWRSPYGFFNR